MRYDPETHHRRSIRLKGYHYSQPGLYAVTICSWHRQPLFETPEVHEILSTTWLSLPDRFPTVTVELFVIMPDHVHSMLRLHSAAKDTSTPTLGQIIGAYTSLTTVAWLRWNKSRGMRCSRHLWQERFYDHIVRNDQDAQRIREYILNNPLKVQLQQGKEIDDKMLEVIMSTLYSTFQRDD